MSEFTKINFNSNRIHRLSDYTELIELLFPGNKNQQHTAASVLYELKWSDSIIPNLVYIENKYSVSRRTLQRTRAKLSRLGLIEHISYLNSRHDGQSGWKMSTRFCSSLRKLADFSEHWTKEKSSRFKEKEKLLLELLM